MALTNSADLRSSDQIKREGDRRANLNTVQFPLLDSDFNIIRKDRRKVADRRKVNMKLIWQENQPIRNTSELHIVVGDKTYRFGKDMNKFRLGRAAQNSLCIQSQFISKYHAYIEYKDGEFVLYDNSMNGSFVNTEELGKVFIREQKVYLYGKGEISLGVPLDHKDNTVITFDCF